MTGRPNWKSPAGMRLRYGSAPTAKTTSESLKGNRVYSTHLNSAKTTLVISNSNP